MQRNKPPTSKKLVAQLIFIAGLFMLLVALKSNSPDGLEKVAADNNFSDKENAIQYTMARFPCSDWWVLFSGAILCLIIGYFISFVIKQYGKKYKKK